jgi:hypothetical protein
MGGGGRVGGAEGVTLCVVWVCGCPWWDTQWRVQDRKQETDRALESKSTVIRALGVAIESGYVSRAERRATGW